MSRPPPHKPSAPLGTIVWKAGGGRPVLIREDLPVTKDDLEAAIASKFVGALRERTGKALHLHPRTEPNGWPDFEGTLDGRKIGIEIVEAIVPEHGRKRSRQDEYLDALLPRIADLEADLRGLCITICDAYQEPEWPPLRSRLGQRLLEELEANLRAAVPELQQTGPRGKPSFGASHRSPRRASW